MRLNFQFGQCRAIAQQCLVLCFSFVLFGCATSAYKPDGHSNGAVLGSTSADAGPEYVRNLPKSRYGNMEEYTVFGKKYRVLDTAANFVEKGDASWYGTKFHGRKTSSGEIYNMHAMTAAHKHIPIPTYARVTRLDNGKSIIVKINDRGPFVGDRIIDLSYAAAIELDMAEQGLAPVEVVALSTHHVVENAPESQMAASDTDDGFVEMTNNQFVIQLAAFSSAPNAEEFVSSISDQAGLNAFIEQNADSSLFRVKMGPLTEGEQLNSTLANLASVGIDQYTLHAAAR